MIGTTKEEAQDAVRNSRIPVYTVAALREDHTDEQISHAKGLGAFARISAGGNDYAPLVEGMDASQAGSAILEDSRAGVILTLDTSKLSAGRDEMLLSVQLQNGTVTYSDSMYLYAADLRFAPQTEEITEEVTEEMTEEITEEVTEEITEEASEEKAAEKETEEATERATEGKTEEETQTETEKETSGSGGNPGGQIPGAVLALAALALAAAAAVLAVAVRRRKAGKAGQTGESGTDEADGFERVVVREIRPGPAPETPGRDSRNEDRAAPGRSYHVRFAAIGREDLVFDLVLPEERDVTVGRNKKADYVLNQKDQYLSSVHCKVRCMQGAMSIWDLDSQNGTFVNGVPIRQIGMATVQTGDSVRLGGFEYRVFITVEEGNSDGN